MRYAEYPAPKELAEWIECFWVFENTGVDIPPETIVADGYPELIVHFGSPYSELDHEGIFKPQPRAVVSGQITGPLILRSPDQAGVVSIRFKPAGMTPFVSVPMRMLTDFRIPAIELFENVDEYVREIQSALSDRDRVRLAVRFLLRSLNSTRPHIPIMHAVDTITKARGNVSVEALARKLHMGRRNLEMQFLKDVGVTPKQFCRIIRFRCAYDLLSEKTSSAATVALDAGFFDQSHLIRDFRAFTGSTPLEFLETKQGISHALISGE